MNVLAFIFAALSSYVPAGNPEVNMLFTDETPSLEGSCRSISEHWDMEEASGNITGECGRTAAMTANGTPVYEVTSATSGAGEGITFDGSTDYFSLADDADLDAGIGTNMVVDAWVFFTAISGDHTIVSKVADTNAAGAEPGYSFYIDSTGDMIGYFESGATTSTGTCETAITGLYTWYHIRWEVDFSDTAAELDCMVEGWELATANLDDNIAGSTLANAEAFLIGATGDASGAGVDKMFNGTIADVRICIGATALTDCRTDYPVAGKLPRGVEPSSDNTDEFLFGNARNGAMEVGSRINVSWPPTSSDQIETDATQPPGLYVGSDIDYTFWSLTELDGVWTENGSAVMGGSGGCGVNTPYGNQDVGNSVVDDDGAGEEYIESTVTCSSGNPCTFGVWMIDDGEGSGTMTVYLDGTTQDCTPTATWTWCSVTDAAASGASVTARVYPAEEGVAADTGRICVWNPEGYAADFERSPSPTAATVTGTDIYVAGFGGTGTFSIDSGAFCAWIWLDDDDGVGAHTVWASSSATIEFQITGGEKLRLFTSGLADNLEYVTTGTVTPRTWEHVCVAFDRNPTFGAAIVELFLDGTELTALDTADFTWTANQTDSNVLRIGNSGAFDASALDGYINYVTYWKVPPEGRTQVFADHYNATKLLGGFP